MTVSEYLAEPFVDDNNQKNLCSQASDKEEEEEEEGEVFAAEQGGAGALCILLHTHFSRPFSLLMVNFQTFNFQVLVLISIVVLFVCCSTPAAVLAVIFSDKLDGHLGFQVAIAFNFSR